MTDIKVITNCQVVTENGIIWDGVIVVNKDRIAEIGKSREIKIPENAEIIDANGNYVGPGFVDIHNHGGNGKSINFHTKDVAEFFLDHGVTSILATVEYEYNEEKTLKAIRTIKEAMKSAKTVKGMYFEGPFINVNYGAFAQDNPWKDNISADVYKKIVNEAGCDAKVWAFAPERPDVLPFLEYARTVNPNVKFAIAHSEATPDEIRALGKYKPTIQTHSMNATGRKNVPDGTRGVGPDEYCLINNEVYTEIISDSCCIHVNADIQKLIIHCKGVHRTILITDSTAYDFPPPPNLSHITDLNFDDQGGLSGSKMTMECACRNVMSATNCGIAQAFIMASTSPARAIGMGNEIGSIEVGKRADLVFVDDKFNVKKVMLEGDLVR